MGTPNRRPSDPAILKRITENVGKSLQIICRAWDAASEATLARGYGRTSPGPQAAAGVVRADPNDPLHTRQMGTVNAKSSAFGDPAGNAAVQFNDGADRWMRQSRTLILWLLSSSAAGERQLTGPFNPPAMERALMACAADMVHLWPLKFGTVVDRLYSLANEANAEWPETPAEGETVGDVTVGRRSPAPEVCAECRQQVNGGAIDPIRRIDGKPYHLRPCYETVRKRKQRRQGVTV